MAVVQDNLRTFVAESFEIESEDVQDTNTMPKANQNNTVTQINAALKEAYENAALKEAYEKWVTLNEELGKVEAQIQQAHTSEYEKMKKEYKAAQQKVRAKYNKWQTQAHTTTNRVIVINIDSDDSDNDDVNPSPSTVGVVKPLNLFTEDS